MTATQLRPGTEDSVFSFLIKCDNIVQAKIVYDKQIIKWIS